jgi:hypothetical protein
MQQHQGRIIAFVKKGQADLGEIDKRQIAQPIWRCAQDSIAN